MIIYEITDDGLPLYIALIKDGTRLQIVSKIDQLAKYFYII